ncbi:MAG: type I 3-dehydroquinate dehydratase [Planctomycetota bacterium]
MRTPRDVLGGGHAVRLHVAVAAPPAVRVPGDLSGLAPEADVLELRLDLLGLADSHADLEPWIALAGRPVLATIRSRAQGGRFGGTPGQAAARLLEAARAGATWLDAEAEVLPLLDGRPPGVFVLASAHDGRRLGTGRADARKVARCCARASELEALVAEAAAARATPVPYGPLGPLREGLVAVGWLFGAAGAAGVVVGQPRLADMLTEGRVGEVSPAARRFALLGTPPSRSPSPALHDAAFRQAGVDAFYVALPDTGLDEALQLGLDGFSITAPLKGAAADRADEPDAIVQHVRAANTLLRTSRGWAAYNTDVGAIATCLPAPRPGADAAIVHGSGGYAAAALAALTGHGYRARLVARDAARGRALAARYGDVELSCTVAPRDDERVYVNATAAAVERPQGLAVGDLAGRVVVDGPYAQPGGRTAVGRAAEADGALLVVDGRQLLLEQAVLQAGLFLGETRAPEAQVLAERRLALGLALDPPPPLVLVGHRGAGKTTVGRALARQLGRPFLDLDGEIERMAGQRVGAVLDALGDEAFRQVEAELLVRAVARRGAVVATGGGTVIAPGAVEHLRREAFVVALVAPRELRLDRLRHDEATYRPLAPGRASAEEDARWREQPREARLADVVDATVDASGTVEDVVVAVRRVAWSGRVYRPIHSS